MKHTAIFSVIAHIYGSPTCSSNVKFGDWGTLSMQLPTNKPNALLKSFLFSHTLGYKLVVKVMSALSLRCNSNSNYMKHNQGLLEDWICLLHELSSYCSYAYQFHYQLSSFAAWQNLATCMLNLVTRMLNFASRMLNFALPILNLDTRSEISLRVASIALWVRWLTITGRARAAFSLAVTSFQQWRRKV